MWVRVSLKTLRSDLALEQDHLKVRERIAGELSQLRYFLESLLVLELCHIYSDFA